MRRLFAEETVTEKGIIQMEEVKLYTRPEKPPLLIGAGVTAETAGWIGRWADGLITISQPLEKLKKVVKAFKENGVRSKPILKVQLSCQHLLPES